jgi:hypothetical protein
MHQPELLDSDIRALQEWLRAAWQQLGDRSLTTFARRELRNQMKQCSADLRACLQRTADINRSRPPGSQLRPSPRPRREFWPGNSGLVTTISPIFGQPLLITLMRFARSRDRRPWYANRHIGLTNDGRSTCGLPWLVPAILA